MNMHAAFPGEPEPFGYYWSDVYGLLPRWSYPYDYLEHLNTFGYDLSDYHDSSRSLVVQLALEVL